MNQNPSPKQIIKVVEATLLVKGIRTNDSSTETVKGRIIALAVITMHYPAKSNPWYAKQLNCSTGKIKWCSKRFTEIGTGKDDYSKAVMNEFIICIEQVEKLKG